MEENEKIISNIKNCLINQSKQDIYGIYNVLIKIYSPLISKLLNSGYKVNKIIHYIESELNIEQGTINYQSFQTALGKTCLIKKGTRKTSEKIDKPFEQIKKLDPEQILELDKINLNITGQEIKRKSAFDDD